MDQVPLVYLGVGPLHVSALLSVQMFSMKYDSYINMLIFEMKTKSLNVEHYRKEVNC